jgi:hypothetical protein
MSWFCDLLVNYWMSCRNMDENLGQKYLLIFINMTIWFVFMALLFCRFWVKVDAFIWDMVVFKGQTAWGYYLFLVSLLAKCLELFILTSVLSCEHAKTLFFVDESWNISVLLSDSYRIKARFSLSSRVSFIFRSHQVGFPSG